MKYITTFDDYATAYSAYALLLAAGTVCDLAPAPNHWVLTEWR